MTKTVKPTRDFGIPLIIYTIIMGILKFTVLTGSGILDTLAFSAFAGAAFFATSLPMQTWARITIAVLVLGLGVPIIGMGNTFYLDVAINIGIYAALALGLNIVVGFAGLLDLGFIAFYAVGAYTWGLFGSSQANNFIAGNHFPLAGDWWFLFVILAVIVAGTFGVLLGLPVLRLKGDYLAVVTLGFGEVIRVLANNLDKPTNFTNGPQGISAIGRPLVGVGKTLETTFGQQAFKWELMLLYALVIVIIGLAVLLTIRLDHSKIGRAWVAIREDEVAAQAMGVPLLSTKLIAFATGASFSGAMGALFAAKQTFISPESFNFDASVGILAMVVLGGLGSIQGALLGAFIVSVLNFQILPALGTLFNDLRNAGVPLSTAFEVSKYQRFIFGIILIVMMIFRPQGLVAAARRLTAPPKEEVDPA
jgi:branched-chain amino acid transport system permease protein